MKAKRRLEIRLETHEVTVIRYGPNVKIFCPLCRTMTPHLTIDQAALALTLAAGEVDRLAAEGKIHALETGNRVRFFCGQSLAELP